MNQLSGAEAFVRMLQLSPMPHLARRRMVVAAELLLATDATLADIAGRVGYQSEFAFGRAFKRHHRVAPGTFKQASSSCQRSAWLCRWIHATVLSAAAATPAPAKVQGTQPPPC